MAFKDPDNPDPKLIAHLVAIYEDSARRMREQVISPKGRTDSAKSFNQQRAAALNAQVQAEVDRLKKLATQWTAQATQQSITTGVKQADSQAKDFNFHPIKSMAIVNTGAVEVLAKDTLRDLHGAADSMGKNAGITLRRMAATGVTNEEVNKILSGGIIEGKPDQAIRQLKEALQKVHGNKVTITDKNGDPMDFDTGYYAKMVAHTKMRQATCTARHDRLAQHGIDLVIVVGRRSDNFCTEYLNKVFSISGKSDTYPPLSSLPGGGPPFHPNCSKSTAPFIEDLATPQELEIAAPDKSLNDALKTKNITTLQKRFKNSNGPQAAEQRQRELADAIRARAQKNGYTPPTYGDPRKATPARAKVTDTGPTKAATTTRRTSTPPKVATPPTVIKAKPGPVGEMIPPATNQTAGEKASQKTNELKQKLAETQKKKLASKQTLAEIHKQLAELQAKLDRTNAAKDAPVTVGITSSNGGVTNVTGVADEKIRSNVVQGLLVATDQLKLNQIPSVVRDAPELFKGTLAKDSPAAFLIRTGEIIINPNCDYWKDPKARMDKAFKEKWASSDNVHHAVIHEVGHWAHRESVGEEQFRKLDKSRLTKSQVELIQGEVSRYGATKRTEFVAEVFAGKVAGRKFSDEVMKLYQKFGGPKL